MPTGKLNPPFTIFTGELRLTGILTSELASISLVLLLVTPCIMLRA